MITNPSYFLDNIMTTLVLTLSITLAVIPSIVFRYAIFSKMISRSQFSQLLKVYSVSFLFQTLLIFFLLHHNINLATTLFYKAVNIIMGLFFFMINYVIVKGMFFKHVFVLGMQGCYCLVLHAVSSIILSYFSFEKSIQLQLIEHSFLYILFFLIVSLPLWHILKDSLVLKYSSEHDYYWNIIWLIPGLLFVSNLFSTINDTWINSWRQFASRVFLGGVLYIFWSCINLDFKELNDKFLIQSENKLLQLQTNAINSQADIITENNKKLSIFRHDLRHHVYMLSSLIESGELSAATNLLSKLNSDLESTKPSVFCKNPIINAPLLVYISRAQKEQIEVLSEIDIPEIIPWDSKDLAILIANALENAIHASNKQEPGQKVIHISTRCEEGKLGIHIKNRFDGEINFDKDGLPIASQDNHGIGMRSLSSIIEKHHGHMACSYEQGWFSIHFMFSEYYSSDRNVISPSDDSNNTISES